MSASLPFTNLLFEAVLHLFRPHRHLKILAGALHRSHCIADDDCYP